MKINKVHCFFEQSGTFKNEFKKLGIQAFDYDIQNNYGETDFVMDLFDEIEKAYDDKPSVFDGMNNCTGGYEDLIMAFFPCIYFSTVQMNYYDLTNHNLKRKNKLEQIEYVLERIENRTKFHILLYKLIGIAYKKNIKIIVENPYSSNGFLFMQNFPKPSMIDRNRSLRGDVFKKPTAYWFFNCEPTIGFTQQKDKKLLRIEHCKKGDKAGVCSEERSLIHPDYAKNFICDNILGMTQENINNQQLSLF